MSKVGIAISVVYAYHDVGCAIQAMQFSLQKQKRADVFTAFTYLTNYILNGNEVHISYWTNLGFAIIDSLGLWERLSVLPHNHRNILQEKLG